MIFKKPYAFFIKMFKPIHIIVSILIAYLTYLNGNILSFFNTYLTSSESVVGGSIKNSLINNFLFIIPIIIIILSLIVLGVMVRKQKPLIFYIVNIFLYIAVTVIYIYTANFLTVLEESIVAIKSVKLIHDLVLISTFIEIVTFVFFLIRGLGVNLKKFDFDSDLSKFDLSESDKEEFELNINIDLSETRRRRKEKIRFLKYKYVENKFIINIIFVVVILALGIIMFLAINNRSKKNTEGNIYVINNLNIGVNNTIVLNTNYRGEKITDNYLIIVNASLQSYLTDKKIYSNDFNLRIGDAVFTTTSKYSKYLIDIGAIYDESKNISEASNYLFVYEIPEKYITSDMVFSYSNGGERLDISIEPKDLVTNDLSVSKKISDDISFSDTLGDISFKINDYEIKDVFVFNYNYCVSERDCISSKEYVKPSINTNFDKTILRLNVNYNNSTNLNLSNFYSFFTKFGYIEYKLSNEWYIQSANFEELKSTKTSDKNNVYIGVKQDIVNADEINLIFNIRGSKYKYQIK